MRMRPLVCWHCLSLCSCVGFSRGYPLVVGRCNSAAVAASRPPVHRDAHALRRPHGDRLHQLERHLARQQLEGELRAARRQQAGSRQGGGRAANGTNAPPKRHAAAGGAPADTAPPAPALPPASQTCAASAKLASEFARPGSGNRGQQAGAMLAPRWRSGRSAGSLVADALARPLPERQVGAGDDLRYDWRHCVRCFSTAALLAGRSTPVFACMRLRAVLQVPAEAPPAPPLACPPQSARGGRPQLAASSPGSGAGSRGGPGGVVRGSGQRAISSKATSAAPTVPHATPSSHTPGPARPHLQRRVAGYVQAAQLDAGGGLPGDEGAGRVEAQRLLHHRLGIREGRHVARARQPVAAPGIDLRQQLGLLACGALQRGAGSACLQNGRRPLTQSATAMQAQLRAFRRPPGAYFPPASHPGWPPAGRL